MLNTFSNILSVICPKYVIIVLIIIIATLAILWFNQNQKLRKQLQIKKDERGFRQKLIDERAKVQEQNVQLAIKNRKLESDTLKFQLQPHTLNNILASLRSLSFNLNRGIEALSETLEYILYSGENQLVTIQEEIGFIKKYLDLNYIFLAGFDSIKIDTSRVDEGCAHYKERCIPHLVTAYFLENAFKHGDTKHAEFLRINIILLPTYFELRVVNRIKVGNPIKVGGIGLSNMKKRLELLLQDEFEITNSKSDYEYHTSLKIKLLHEHTDRSNTGR